MQANTTAIVLPRPINRVTAERVFQEAQRMAFKPCPDLYDVRKGLRAVRDRNPRLLKALEEMVEVLDAQTEEQLGRWQRGTSRTFTERVKPEVLQGYTQAYLLASEAEYNDKAIQPYGYLIAAVAKYADVI